MNNNSKYPGIVSIAGLITALGIARGCDAWMAFLRQRNAETFDLNVVVLWSYGLASLLLAAFLLFLFRFVVDRAPRNVWIAGLYVFAGLFIVAYPPLEFTPVLCCWFPRLDSFIVSPISYVSWTGAFVAVSGLAMLVLAHPKPSQP